MIRHSEGSVIFLSKLMHGIGGVALVSMMFFTVTDVALRYLGKPIMGSNDVIGIIGLLAIAFAIPQTTRLGAHIYVDALVDKMSAGTRRVVGIITRLLSMGLFILLFSGAIMKGWEFMGKGEVSQTLHISLCWVIFAFAFCSLIQATVIIADVVKLIKGETTNG
jgi:TRAP-type transport system small permease protein